jgi:hypothetical protein
MVASDRRRSQNAYDRLSRGFPGPTKCRSFVSQLRLITPNGSLSQARRHSCKYRWCTPAIEPAGNNQLAPQLPMGTGPSAGGRRDVREGARLV